MAPNVSFVNVADLNKDLRSEVFVNEDRQLRAIHLILGFEPLSNIFQDTGNLITAGDRRLARIDVMTPRFLAREDVAPVEIYRLRRR